MTTATAPVLGPQGLVPEVPREVIFDRLQGLKERLAGDGAGPEPSEEMVALWRAITTFAVGASRLHPDDLGGIVEECADNVLGLIENRLSFGPAYREPEPVPA